MKNSLIELFHHKDEGHKPRLWIHGDPDQRWPGQICLMCLLGACINICPDCPVHDHYFCYFVWLLLLHIS